MRPSITAERGIVVGIAFALTLQAVNGYFAYRAATDYVQAAQDRRASLNILQHSEGYLSLLKDAETGQRGFVLTADPSYLDPYKKAVAGLSESRSKFYDSARDEYPDVLTEVDRHTNKLMAELGETIDLQLNDPVAGQAAAQELVRGGAGKHSMDELRRIISDLEDRERVRLGQIGESMDQLARDTPPRVLLVSSLAVVLIAVAGWVAYRDVRRRTAAEAKIREQRSLLDSILDNISDGVLVADAQGRLQLVNRAAQQMHGQDGTGAPSTQWNRRFGLYRLDRETLIPNEELALARAVRGEAVDQAELYLKPPTAEEGIYLGVSGRPLRDDHGSLLGGVIVMRDITYQKQAEQRTEQTLAELERRVAERTAELTRTNHELQQKNQENETFVYSVSHDLRSPLVNLQGFSQELALSCNDLRTLFHEADVPHAVRARGMKVLDEDFEHSIRFIQSAVIRLADIINALLKLSRAGRVEYQVESVAVDEVVARIVESMQSEAERRGVTIQVESLPAVEGDQLAIEQVFANLLDNALKYSDPKRPGKIAVGVLDDEPATNFRTFFVCDNGLGLPEQGRDKVFKAFERFHGNIAPGEGMGLAIVKRIVNRHGGEIRLESSPGEGCVFYVSLPMAPLIAPAVTLFHQPTATSN